MKTNNLRTTLISVVFFSLAMGFLESAVVIYLRELLYPGGFKFPLQPISRNLAIVELFREAATLIMLVGIAIIAAKSAVMRFAYFLLSFAIWDIAYYVFLKAFLNWPSSLMEWDVLFLLPSTWTGPVLSPLILCILMISLASVIIYFNRQGKAPMKASHLTMLIVGALLSIAAFVTDYIRYSIDQTENFHWTRLLDINHGLLLAYEPTSFPWLLFSISVCVIMIGILSYIHHYYINQNKVQHAQLF